MGEGAIVAIPASSLSYKHVCVGDNNHYSKCLEEIKILTKEKTWDILFICHIQERKDPTKGKDRSR